MQQRFRAVLFVLLIAAAGIGVSLLIEQEHHRISSDPSYVSFCRVNERVDCERVLSSEYSSVFGISVSLWSTFFYSSVLLLGLLSVVRDSFAQRRQLASLIFALSMFGLLFSLYLAAVSLTVLTTICLMCSTLYLVSLGLFVSSWRFRRQLVPVNTRRGAANEKQDRWIVWGGLAAAMTLIAIALWEALGGPAAAVSADEIKTSQPEFYKWYFDKPVVAIPTDRGNSHGATTAPITIVEFSDFGCSHCAAFDHALEQVLRSGRQEQVRVIYRHFPLDAECNPAIGTSAHPNACLAAVAAECAGEQGKFWPYHKVLFENQSRFKRSELIDYATRVDLDKDKFEACLQSDAVRQRVAEDAAEGVRLQIQSTPTWFLNGRKIEGALEARRLADALTLALASTH